VQIIDLVHVISKQKKINFKCCAPSFYFSQYCISLYKILYMLLIEIRNYTETKCINIGILINIDDQVLWTPYTLIIFIINKIYYMYSIQRLEYCSTDGSRGSSCRGSASNVTNVHSHHTIQVSLSFHKKVSLICTMVIIFFLCLSLSPK
jgi:hypothetical protein